MKGNAVSLSRIIRNNPATISLAEAGYYSPAVVTPFQLRSVLEEIYVLARGSLG